MLCPQAFNIQVSGVVAKKEKEKQEEKEAPFLIACLLATPTVPSLGFLQDPFPSDLTGILKWGPHSPRVPTNARKIPRTGKYPQNDDGQPCSVGATWDRRRIAGDIDLQPGLVPSVSSSPSHNNFLSGRGRRASSWDVRTVSEC